MKKAMLIISILSVIFGSCSCSPINNSTTNSAESSVVETTSPENNETDTEISTTEETIETNVFSNDGSEIIVDTDKSNVEISETSDGTKVATVKTDDGKEVKVAVKEDESGKTVVDTSKVINDEGQVENSADSSKNKTEVKVNDDGKVTIKTEVSVPVETSKNNSTNSKPSETSKKTTENSKSSDTSKTAETSKSSESSNTKTTPTKKIAAETEESSSNIEAKSISLNKSSLTLKVGETTTLTATVSPSNATNKTVIWKSTNNSIATVNNGKITAIKEGNVTITASTNCNCKEAICKVTVINNEQSSTPSTVEVTSITLNKTNVTLGEGKTTTLTATVNPSNATNKNVTWSSDNTSIATVNNGKVTAKKAGTANITARSNNGKTATCKVTITHEHNWKAIYRTVHHDATYKYEDVYENVETKIWWDGICANDWEIDQNGNWKDSSPASPTYKQIVSPDVRPCHHDLYWADGRNELHTVCKSLTPMGETTPWYMILEYLGYCTLDDILNCKYDWVIKRNTSDWYDDGIYYAIDIDKLFKQEHRAYTACSEYCGSTTNSNDNPIYIKSIYEYKKTGQKKVIDTPAYDEKVVDHYECSCGATK